MSAYPTDQRCPRCQYPVPQGATACVNCGLAFQPASGAYPGANPAYPGAAPAYPPPTPSAPGPSYSTVPAADPYGGGSGGYGSQQQPTYYSPPGPPGPSGTYGAAPTVASSLYPQAPAPGGYPGSQPPPGFPPPPPAYPASQPQGGYGAPPGYPGGSQPQGPYGTAPGYSGSQPATDFGAPPTFGSLPQSGFGAPPLVAAPPAPKKGRGLMIAIIVIVVVVLIAGGGTAAYLLTRPKPVITFDKTAPGNYAMGSTPAGAIGTYFCISGTKFSGSSTVTFMLDGQNVPDNGTFQTNSDGALTSGGSNACGNSSDVALKVTSGWGMGPHSLTAVDASKYATQSGIPIIIVKQGTSGTPGPNGAPTDSATFTLTVQVDRKDAVTGSDLGTLNERLCVNGCPGGAQAVCQVTDSGQVFDDGQPHTVSGTLNDGTPYQETFISTCSGSYQDGMLTYTQTITSDQLVAQTNQGQLTCVASTPYVGQKLVGTFADAKNITGGMYTADQINVTCTINGQTLPNNPSNPENGTWTGSSS